MLNHKDFLTVKEASTSPLLSWQVYLTLQSVLGVEYKECNYPVSLPSLLLEVSKFCEEEKLYLNNL